MARSGASAGPSVLFRPLADLLRLRASISLDLLLTLGVTALAIGLAVAYQVVGRWARRSGA